jgi:site-specific DNA recombinase
MTTVAAPRRIPSGEPALTIALLYRRVSTREQAEEGVSLDAQLAESRRYVVRQDWILGDEYEDIETGLHDDRRDYQRMLMDIRGHRLAGRCVCLVLASLDRLGRNLAERVRAWDELKRLGVQIHSVREGGLVSEFTYNILASVAQEESRKNGERVAASRRYVAQRGWWPVGRAAWGYRWRPATAEEREQGAPNRVLEPHPDEAPWVREAWARRAAGESLKGVACWVAGLPEVARGERNLRFSAIYQMFRAPVYIGRFDPDGPSGRWEPLIDDETWRRVRERDVLHQKMPAQASGKYPLTGLIRCHHCGSRMGGRTSVHRHRTKQGVERIYRVPEYVCRGYQDGARGKRDCNTYVSGPLVDEVVFGTVCELLVAVEEPNVRDAVRRAWAERERAARDDHAERRIAALEQGIQATRRRISTASVKFLDGELDRAAYDIVRVDLQAELESAEAEVARLRGRQRPAGLPAMDAVLAGVGGWARALRSAPIPARREVLGVLIDQVIPVRLGYGRYEAQVAWSPIGRALLSVAVQVGRSGNLLHLDQFGQAT